MQMFSQLSNVSVEGKIDLKMKIFDGEKKLKYILMEPNIILAFSTTEHQVKKNEKMVDPPPSQKKGQIPLPRRVGVGGFEAVGK